MNRKTTIERYIDKYPNSKSLHESSKNIFPRGVPHDAWFILPFPIYIEKAQGSYEWDVDGYKYVDYFGGHGGLILGHSHPSLTRVINKQIEKGTHYGGCNELQVKWGDLIKNYIPCAERVEFTNSGTEAMMLAIRLARAFTGRNKIIKFRGQMGGWYDSLMIDSTSGLLPEVIENTIIVPINNEEILEEALASKEVALVICEAIGAFTGITGIEPTFYNSMRELTHKYGTLFLFDEVITAFRYLPGGAQKAKGIFPDLTILGKMVTGGMPGSGCVVGRADVMDKLQFSSDQRVPHPGTYNANPLCAASGIAALEILETGEPQTKANEMAAILREGFRRIIKDYNVNGCVFGESSVYHLYFGDCSLRSSCDGEICLNDEKDSPLEIKSALYMNLALNGVHTSVRAVDGFVSAAHSSEDIDKTIKAFELSVKAMKEENIIK